jgi:DNA-binding NtrC family response regulator
MDLPPEIRKSDPVQDLINACSRCFAEESMSLGQVVSCLESNLLRQAFREAAGDCTQADRALGLSLSTLRDKRKKHDLEVGEMVQG